MMSAGNPPSRAPNAPPKARKSGVVVPNQPKWHQRLVARLVCLFTRGLAATLRFRLNDTSGFFSEIPKEKVIFAIWHNRLALALILYERYVGQRDRHRKMAALVSASRDGALLARILELFNVRPVRGSSSRRGAQALRELVTWGERDHDLAVTPDGPRGPRYVVQEGVISAAQLTGLRIVPASYRLNWKITFKSWDRFQMPLPFARCDVVTGPALRVPREATAEERELLRRQLEEQLRAITQD